MTMLIWTMLIGLAAGEGAIIGHEVASSGEATTTGATPMRSRGRRVPVGVPGRAENGWRYVFHGGHWWYWSPSERWSYFDRTRWAPLDSLNQPLERRDRMSQLRQDTARPFSGPRAPSFSGTVPSPRSRAGSFADAGEHVVGAARTLPGDFGAGQLSPGDSGAASDSNRPAPYGPASAYGAYGTTNPFAAGFRSGSGGSFGYGLGSPAARGVSGFRPLGVDKRP